METARMRLLGVFFTCFALTGSINLSASANNFILTVSPPNNVQNGEVVHISWSGVKNPTKDDFIGLYCPNNDSAEHFVYRKTKEYGRVSFLSPASWINGTGTHDVHVYNLRTEFCEFRYYKINGSLTELLGKSKTFFFRNVADAPLHGHLALTGSPTEMRVMWTSAKGMQTVSALNILLSLLDTYGMFHVTWTTFKFNRNQLGTVSAYVMISVPWSNQRAR